MNGTPLRALVTGASTGIGYELAKLLARDGHSVILNARNQLKLEEVAAELRTLGSPGVHVLAADLSQAGAPKEIERQLADRKLDVDVLINNAGFGAVGEFAKLELGPQTEMIQVNITALVELTHRLLPPMIARRRGWMMNVASTAAFQPGPSMAVYYATKAFVLSFSQALSQELSPHGIRVSALCPGPTKTEFQARAGAKYSKLFTSGLMPVQDAEAVAKVGYRAMWKGKPVAVSGIVNKLGVFGTRFAPRSCATKLAGKVNRNKQ